MEIFTTTNLVAFLTLLALEIVLASGEVTQLGSACVKDVAGYSLKDLFVGSEGMLIADYGRFKLYPEDQFVGVRRPRLPRPAR